MSKCAITFAIIITAIVALSDAASPQDSDAGKFEFQVGCAACHGIDGKGKGPVSPLLRVPPADLTILAKKNNGVFPLSTVYDVIDGRTLVMVHGTHEMPIWGNRYTPGPNKAASQNPAESFVNPSYDPETIVRIRILAVIDYLNRIQEK